MPTAMILEGEDQRQVRGDEGAVSNGVNDVFEGDFGAHGPAVRDDGFVIGVFAVPAVQFDTTASRQEDL